MRPKDILRVLGVDFTSMQFHYDRYRLPVNDSRKMGDNKKHHPVSPMNSLRLLNFNPDSRSARFVVYQTSKSHEPNSLIAVLLE